MNQFKLPIIVLTLFLVCSTQISAQSKLPDDSVLTKKTQFLIDYRKEIRDFLSASFAAKGNDIVLFKSLGDIATYNMDKLGSLSDLLFIESLMNCETDKVIVRGSIKHTMKYIQLSIDDDISRINKEGTLTTNQVLISMGIRLKDELRKIKELLN